jgi:hypothetical protein
MPLFVYLQPDLLSPVCLVKRRRAGDFEPDHVAVLRAGIDLSRFLPSAVDYQRTHPTGNCGCRQRRLGIFILHQTVFLCIGYFVMTWNIPDAVKWVFVVTSSFIVIVALYTLFIRKIEFLRFLFGMKTTHFRFDVFRKRNALIALQVLFVGLIFFAAVNMGRSLSPMPLMYDS